MTFLVRTAELDALLAAGPEDFIRARLAAFLELTQDVPTPDDATPDDATPDDATHDDDDAAPDDDPEHTGAEAWKREATRAVRGLYDGTPAAIASLWGVPAAPELVALFDAVRGFDPDGCLTEMRFDVGLLAELPPERNVFELLVLSDQLNYLGTALTEAFAGAVAFAGFGDGDSWHLDVYTDLGTGPREREVTQYVHDEHGFDHQPIALALDDAAFLAAVTKTVREEWLSPERGKELLAPLRGRVRPTWHSTVEAIDPDFEPLEQEKACMAAVLQARASWLVKILVPELGPDLASGLDAVRENFHAKLNPAMTEPALARRLEACASNVCTALYAVWRAYVFDEPELDAYLAIAARHPGRIARDCARLVEELRGGRRALGAIGDWPAHLARVRALDLDPRRAEEREREAAEAAARRQAELAAEAERLAAIDAHDDDALVAFLERNASDVERLALAGERIRHALPSAAQRLLAELERALDDDDDDDDGSHEGQRQELVLALASAIAASTRAALVQRFCVLGAVHGSRAQFPASFALPAFELLEAWTAAGALDTTVAPALLVALRRAASVLATQPSVLQRWSELAARQDLGPATSLAIVEALAGVLPALPSEGGFETALHFDEPSGVIARALATAYARLPAPPPQHDAIVRELGRLASTPSPRLRSTREGAALALATIDPVALESRRAASAGGSAPPK